MRRRAFFCVLLLLMSTGLAHARDTINEEMPLDDYLDDEPADEVQVVLPKIEVVADGQALIDETEGLPYTLGVDDRIQIDVIQPEKISSTVTVSPDGFISFPYIGSLKVKDKTLTEIQDEIVKGLTDGYMKYPIVSVILLESRSRKFFVYGEVMRPGTFPLEDNMTVMRAISMAGGFTKYGSMSRVKVLKPRKNLAGYDTLKINLKGLMDGDAQADQVLENGDIVVVSEGVF